MKMNNSLVGKRIGQLRKRRGLSQLMLSEMIDRSPTHLSYIETGAKSISTNNAENNLRCLFM